MLLLNARNESVPQPQLNLHLAKVYLAGTDSGVSTRTWQNALEAIIKTKSGPTQDRCRPISVSSRNIYSRSILKNWLVFVMGTVITLEAPSRDGVFVTEVHSVRGPRFVVVCRT